MSTKFKWTIGFNQKIRMKEAVNSGRRRRNFGEPREGEMGPLGSARRVKRWGDGEMGRWGDGSLINRHERQSAIISVAVTGGAGQCNRDRKNQGIDRESTQQHSSWFDAKKLPQAR
ncbi:hypothetical protein QUB63_33845 [Microcoleus sp. ARI1-B5]|uniref:hypothetical protein n=1 Tax=unclassified Microcoleus TaxID=2642155 RepID=UPI002FD25BDC